jgi:hypothetical protein
MKVKWKEVISQTAQSTKRDDLYVSIVIKHFFIGLKSLMKQRKLFKDNGMFKSYIKKPRRKRTNVK